MATEVHVNITSDNSTNQVVFHNPGRTVQPGSAGLPVTASAKIVGQPNSVVHGQISNSTVIVDNPA